MHVHKAVLQQSIPSDPPPQSGKPLIGPFRHSSLRPTYTEVTEGVVLGAEAVPVWQFKQLLPVGVVYVFMSLRGPCTRCPEFCRVTADVRGAPA
jgi:hypothetical protein